MFYNTINTAIDTVQDAKSSFVKSFVTEDSLQKPLQSFIDMQTFYAKSVVDIAKEVSEVVTKKVQSFDYAKAFKV